MRASYFFALLTLFATSSFAEEIAAPDGNSNFRPWHDNKGRVVEATFRGIENGNIYLQTRNGYMYEFPLTNLTPEDQKLAAILKPEGLGIQKNAGLAQSAAIIDKGVLMGLQKAGQKPNALASDEQFVRRVYLDLAGRIPTREETITFLEDKSSSKRANVIDMLVKSDGFNSRMYNYFADMLRIADDAQKAKFYPYQEWLKEQITVRRPWNEVVRDMMVADGKMLDNGAAGYLLRDRGMRLDNLSLTLTTFLGANVACAQCHDHPFSEWSQKQFYEMAAFFGATETYTKGGYRGALKGLRQELSLGEFQVARRVMLVNSLSIVDKAESDLRMPADYKYKDAKPGDPVAPHLINWTKADLSSRLYKDAEGALKNAASERQLREVFANWMTSPQNPRFAMTIANRMWKLVFGVGLKEPVTDLDDPSASSNPLLLQHLANEMVRLKFDIPSFMRLLCNTQTYQREAVTRELVMGEPYYFPGPILRRMSAEQAWDSCVALAIGDKVDDFKMKRADAYAKVMAFDLEDATPATLTARVKEVGGSMRSMLAGNGKPKAGKKGKGKQNALVSMNEEGETVRPEMLDGLVLARAAELRQPEREDHFLRMFGQSDRQIADSNSEEGSVPQVLMLMNGEAQKVMRNPKSLVLATALAQETPEAKVNSLYLSFLARHPTPEELTSAKDALASGLTAADLTWVLFNSREFVFVQ